MWEESVGDWGPGLLDALSRIEGPMKPKGVRHPLPAVLALAVCAMLSGARSLYAIAQWAGNTPSLPGLWSSAGNGPRAWPRCITYFAGWTWMPSRRCWAAGHRNAWERGGCHCHRRQGPAGDTRQGGSQGE